MPAALIKPKHLRGVVLALAAAAPLNAEELRFDNAAQWHQWTLPLGIVELTPQGVVRPLAVRRNINAALDALDHGGGLRGVGSNRATAALVFDGDPATGWQPTPGDLEETGWIEVDLGLGVPASRVSLIFDGTAPPFEIFNLLLSTGEQFIDIADVPVPGTLNVNALHWAADVPSGTRLELRSRSGNELEQNFTYYDKNLKEVTARRWNKLIPSFRGPIDTTTAAGGDWSPWSNIYAASGQTFLSPSLRRFVQLDARLVSDSPLRAPSLDWVSLDFADPIAERVSAEVYPFQVEPGTVVTFSYWLRAPATRAGFDRLAIEASTPLRFVDTHLDGAPIEVQAREDSAGFRLQFPRRVQSGELVEMRFEAAAFLQATRFDLFLEDSKLGPDVRQRVEPGDANPQVESSTNIVELPLDRALFAHLSVYPRVLTPNGDGIGDRLFINLNLINVLEHRPLKLELFDLAGRRVRQISGQALAGAQELVWDGRDQSGDLVPPGHYFLRLKVESDARSQSVSRMVSIVY